QVGQVGARALTADRRQPYPDDRDALALEGRDRLIDPLGVELAPPFGAKLVGRRCGRGRGLSGRLLRLRRAFAVLSGVLLRRLIGLSGLVRLALLALLAALSGAPCRTRRAALADRLTVAEAEHEHDEVGLLRGQHLARLLHPIVGIGAPFVADEAGIGADLA